MNRHTTFHNHSPYKKDEWAVWRWMNSHVPSLTHTMTLNEAAYFLIENERQEAPVKDTNHRFLGILSIADIMQNVLEGKSLQHTVGGFYQRDTPILHPHDELTNIFPFKRSELPVVDEKGFLLGIVSQKDFMSQYAENIKKIDTMEKMIEWFEVCFDTAYEGIAVVDENGIIRMFNEAYSRFVGVKKEDAIGKYAEEVIENSRLPIVLQTGIPERNQAHVLQGQEMIVHRIPIWKGDSIIGAVGMLIFEGVSELYNILERVQTLQHKTPHAFIKIEEKKKKVEKVTFDQIIGESISIADAKKMARRAAQTSASVLIMGESGVGKELFTKAIHDLSHYRAGPFVSINCASIPENLLESELFGYAEGAFTGSRKNGKPGKFELAHKGTIFLDEIGDMPLHMQAKILRVLQEKEVERVGGTKPIPVDFRVIAATNRNLEEMIKEKTFREDLFYRLNVIPITIPPLRERREDIPVLVSHLLQKMCVKNQISPKEMDGEAMKVMIHYRWPGNIRELVNIVERLVTLSEGKRIRLMDLPDYFHHNKKKDSVKKIDEPLLLPQEKNLFQRAKESGLQEEKALISQALIKEGGNKSRAAKRLGMSRATLYNKLKNFNNGWS
ncbi:sigma-54-dependent Fis family transcriptional regulator [Priestia abyssalis]|uniref:sigma-54-dependent Fis family transcriptional regulator n=1 Tax=Priestia abyssalis TaxID=1221450 RepID=UPI0011179239|nr:sigma-54-dependent Fis family transcriptional regulator [Priestia abyssalis]